jgi:hypothetical protein
MSVVMECKLRELSIVNNVERQHSSERKMSS